MPLYERARPILRRPPEVDPAQADPGELGGDVEINNVSSLLTLEDAWEAARLSGLEQDVREMSMGMHTVLREGESTLWRASASG